LEVPTAAPVHKQLGQELMRRTSPYDEHRKSSTAKHSGWSCGRE